MGNMTTLQILQGIKTWVTTKLNLKQDVINDLANIRSGAQAGSTAVQPAELSAYFNDASYDNNTHRINFYHGQTVVAYVDASPFIIDGMVDDVRIENGYLVIDFNTASGKQDISIPLTDIFNPNNYYNKTQTDGLLAQKQDVIQDLADIRSGASAGSTAVQPSTLNNAVKNVVAESGVYDVSANNDNTKFESLSALLSSANLNTLIPTDIRKGGMSIKFVLSSDNKYVQYRLMADTFSTTENDWQGVDDEPTADSENLVKSGGAYTRINEQLIVPFVKLVGKGTTPVDARFKLEAGHKYRFSLSKTTWDTTGISVTVFSIQHTINGTDTLDVAYFNTPQVMPFVEITAVEAESYFVRFRGVVGETLEVYIEDITSVNEMLHVLNFKGLNNTAIRRDLILDAGSTYKIKLSDTNWSTDNVSNSYSILLIGYLINGIATYDVNVIKGQEVNSEYLITAVSADNYFVAFRGDIGASVNIEVSKCSIGHTKNFVNSSLDNTSVFTNYLFEGIRYYHVYNEEIDKGYTIVLENTPSNYQYNIALYDTLEHALAAGVNNAIESSGWNNTEYIVTNDSSKYLAVTVKKSDSIINDSDKAVIDAAIVKVSASDNFIDEKGNIIYPIVKAGCVLYNDTNLRDYLNNISDKEQKSLSYGFKDELKFVGDGNTGVFKYFYLLPGRKYRIKLSNTNWSTTGVSSAKFSIQHIVNGVQTADVAVAYNITPNSYYDITAVEADTYLIGFRGATGATLTVSVIPLIDYSDVLCGSNSLEEEIVQVSDDSSLVLSDAKFLALSSIANRYYFVFKYEIGKGTKVVFDETSDVMICAITSRDTYEHALAPSVNASIEDTGWNTWEYTFTNENSKYLVITFKNSSNTTITDAQKAIAAALSVKMYSPFGIQNKGIKQILDASNIVCGSSNVKSVLDGIAKNFNYQIPFADTDKAISGSVRLRCAVNVPHRPCKVHLETTGIEGYSFALQTNYTKADAQSIYVLPVETYGWNDNDCVFLDSTAPWLCIGFKKNDNSSFSQADIDYLNSCGIVLNINNEPYVVDIEKKDIISQNNESETLMYLRSAKRVEYSTDGNYTPRTPPMTLLHFSDIHGDQENLTRIVSFKNYYSDYIDAALCTGDIIKNKFVDSFTFWDNANAGSILNCTGNHEYYNGETAAPYYQQITQKQVYDKFFAPYIANWDVVQPTDAATNGLNYYYKDFSTYKVRLIVLDNMRYDSAQETWFESVLASAKTAGLHVIAAMHIGSTDETQYECSFNALWPTITHPVNTEYETAHENLCTKVDAFINDGGVFIAWIMGHRHVDTIGLMRLHPNQVSIHVATASCGNAWDIIPKGDNCDRTRGTKMQDCFNIYSIDTYRKRIKIHRIGCDIDKDLRHKGNLTYDYENHRVLWND